MVRNEIYVFKVWNWNNNTIFAMITVFHVYEYLLKKNNRFARFHTQQLHLVYIASIFVGTLEWTLKVLRYANGFESQRDREGLFENKPFLPPDNVHSGSKKKVSANL